MPARPTPSRSPIADFLRQRGDRRGFLFGAAGLGVAGIGAVAGASMLRGGDTPNVPATSVPDPTATTAPTDTGRRQADRRRAVP